MACLERAFTAKPKMQLRSAPLLIILAGLPGTGKTSLARQLAKSLSLVVFAGGLRGGTL
jgi:SpoVK/Ycf46/Vps4 family AAA+-type ATPase